MGFALRCDSVRTPVSDQPDGLSWTEGDIGPLGHDDMGAVVSLDLDLVSPLCRERLVDPCANHGASAGTDDLGDTLTRSTAHLGTEDSTCQRSCRGPNRATVSEPTGLVADGDVAYRNDHTRFDLTRGSGRINRVVPASDRRCCTSGHHGCHCDQNDRTEYPLHGFSPQRHVPLVARERVMDPWAKGQVATS